VVYQIKGFIFVHLRLFDEFTDIVKIELLSSIFVFIGVYFFVDKFKIDAILLVSIIGNLIIIIPALFRIKSLNFSIEYKLLRSLILLGLPLLLFNFLVLLTTSIDRLMISQLVSSNKAALGIFHFGYILSFGVMTAFNSIIYLLVPKVLKQFNSHSQDTDLMMEQSKLVENGIVLIAILGITILPSFIHILMPQYVQSILVMQFLLLAYSVNGLSFLPGTYMIANNLQLKLLPAFLLSLSSAVLLNYLSIELGYGIYGVAISTIFTFGIYTFGLFMIYLHLMKINLFSSLFKIFWKLGVLVTISVILLYEKSNPLWILLLYTLLYGKDFIMLSKLYYPLLKSSIR
jgi:O-antigen/teichoic acid export membrane protein